ncbi:hypothetical protein QNH14_15500 [Apirhabdus apintestini]|nr:hypothetical protein QNH14_15500 [Enterobacteriaceae bacterium CA-0114]
MSDTLQKSANAAYGKNLGKRAEAAQFLLQRNKGYCRKASKLLWEKDVEFSTRLGEKPSTFISPARMKKCGCALSSTTAISAGKRAAFPFASPGGKSTLRRLTARTKLLSNNSATAYGARRRW